MEALKPVLVIMVGRGEVCVCVITLLGTWWESAFDRGKNASADYGMIF